MNEQPSSQEDVQRGLGTLPQQADEQTEKTGTCLPCLRICKPVQVCPACHFVNGQNIGQTDFPVGNDFAMLLMVNPATS